MANAKVTAGKVKVGMAVMAPGGGLFLVAEVRDVGGMVCFSGTSTPGGLPRAFSAHPSDVLERVAVAGVFP